MFENERIIFIISIVFHETKKLIICFQGIKAKTSSKDTNQSLLIIGITTYRLSCWYRTKRTSSYVSSPLWNSTLFFDDVIHLDVCCCSEFVHPSRSGVSYP